jgi:subfamily B ATP-binding cassette protein MsbA
MLPGISSRDRLNFVKLLRPYAGILGVALLAVIGEGVTGLLEPWPLKIVFDTVSGSKPLPEWLARFLPFTGGPDKMAILKLAALAVITIAVLEAGFSYVEKYTTTSAGQWVMHDLRKIVYSHIQHLSLAYHNQKRTGDLISRIINDVDAIQTFIVSNLLGLIIDVLTLLGMAGVMFYLNWRFTLIALSVAPPLFLVTYFYTRRSKKASRDVRQKEGEIASLLQEVLSAISVVKAFAREDYEEERLEQESAQSVQLALNARSLKAKLSPIVGIVVALGTALVLWYGGRLVVGGTLSAGSLIVFIWYLGKMYKPMQDFSKMTDAYTKALVGYERVREIIETEPTVQDLPGSRLAPPLRGAIEFEHVQFGYTQERPVLRDVTFKAAACHMTALVGPTGSGKTTIASLIGRFYDPDSGSVKIDGVDLREFRQRSLHDQLSFVLQENILFHASIRQNIAYGKPGATLAEVQRAAELANADEFISKLPQRYETMVGERGVTLSGGQRQRLAIARAIIRDTPILILDEPSSGLDAASEELVFEALDRLIEGKTAIVIAHRFSTIRRANAILVIEDGSIVESGTHEELLVSGGLYANLHNLQFAHADANPGEMVDDTAGATARVEIGSPRRVHTYREIQVADHQF